MALVSQSIIDEWFKKTSWVYKNFAYLFQNPIWNKDIPKGFSLCPYFWTAMFSMCIFRPFIVPLLLSLKGLSLLLKPFWKILRVTDDLVENYSPIRAGGAGITGMATFAAFVILNCIGLFIYIVTLGSYYVFMAYSGVNALPSIIIPVILAISTVVLAIYKDVSNTDCKVENYNRILVIFGSIIAIWLMPIEFMAVLSTIFSFFVFVVKEIIWACAFLFKGFINAIVYVVTDPLFLIPIIALLATGLIGYILSKYGILDNMSSKMDEEQRKIEEERRQLRNGYSEYEYVKQTLFYHTPHDMDYIAKYLRYFNYSQYLDSYYSHKEYDKFLNSLSKDFNSHVKNIYKMRKEREQKMNAKCVAVTNQLSKVLNVIFWPLRQFKIFFVMMIEIIKSRKQGFCPYKKFTD